MFLERLFGSKVHRRRSTQLDPDEEGRVISRRLQELRDFAESRQIEDPPIECRHEDDRAESRCRSTIDSYERWDAFLLVDQSPCRPLCEI